jgi:hypothetical protein
MPNPDITPYVDLSVYDEDPQSIFEQALLTLQMRIPDWTPREANTEVLLLESMALEVAEAVYAINRVPAAVVETLLKMYQINRDIGAFPTTTITFNMSGNFGYTIPAGTAVRLDVPATGGSVVFTTDIELTIPPGNTSGTVAATGDTFEADVNGIAAGTEVEILDSIVYADSAVLGSIVINGRDPEDDATYFDRGVQRFNRLSDALVIPRHFTAYALEQADVEKAFAIDNYEPPGGTPGSDAGHMTVAVYGDGADLTLARRDELAAEMDALAASMLAVHVIAPVVTTVDVTTQVVSDAGYDDATVIANVQAALQDYLNWENWDWSATVRKNALIQVIGNAEGVAYVDTITVPAGDTALPGVANLVNAGTLNVTVA